MESKIWLFKNEDTIEVRERCIKPFARTAKRSAKFLSSPEKTVPSIAGTVFPSTKIAVAKRYFLAGSFRLKIGRIPSCPQFPE
jgi:hypothetical protein